MLFRRHKGNKIEEVERKQRLLSLIYETKASWDHAKETEEAVYEANASSELHYRTRIQEQKYLYLYQLARQYKVRGELNKGIIQR
ncbi:YaaL family protein [Lactobacillaceae bacterium 24-114]